MRRNAIVAALLSFLLWNVPVEAAHHAKKTPKITKAAARERTERLLPRVTVSADGSLLPDLRAAAAIIYDPETQAVLYESHSTTQRPIASITKVMTATVFLETEPDLDEVVSVAAIDTKHASHTYLKAGDRVTVDDLMHLLLIASDNAAARALARISPYGTVGFIEHMNTKAAELGLSQTIYADSSGLLQANVSSAFDMALLITAVSNNSYITGIMQTAQHTFRTLKNRRVTFSTTDHLLTHDVPVLAAKTGFTNPAGFCLSSLLELPDGRSVAIVVLGAKTNAARFIEVENLYKWLLLSKSLPPLPENPEPAAHMSERGIAFIKNTEQDHFHGRPYYDSNGYAVGYGMHTWQGKKVTKNWPKLVTEEEADAEFLSQLERFEKVVEDSITSPLSQPAYDALVSIAYNLGRVNTRIIEKLSAGQGVTPDDFLVTATVRHHPVAGLEIRRWREFAMFAGDYTGVLFGY